MNAPASTKTELLRTDYLTLTEDGERITLAWHREEPNDDHSVATAEVVKRHLDAFVAAHPGEKRKMLVDLLCVKKTFPRGTAAYTGWLIAHRAQIRGGAFVSKSLLLRAGVSAALLVPGLTMKGFSDLGEANAFLAKC